MSNNPKTRFLALLLALLTVIFVGCGKKDKGITPCGESSHVDTDDNGFCDSCRVSVLVYVDIFSINDLHGKFSDTPSQPGVDELSSYIQNARSKNENVILLSAGDMWQGSPESNLTEGMMITEWMNALDFDAMTLGNHEYDWGEEAIEANDAVAEFPFLAINIFDRESNERVDYCQPSTLIELNGITVGVIGAMGDCYSSIAPDKVEDVYFKTGSALTALVKAESERLRDEGADFIIYLMHDGGTGGAGMSHYDSSLSGGYVDIVFEGHTHRDYVRTDSGGVYHLQGGGDNEGITYASLRYNKANGTSSVTSARYIQADSYQHMPDSPIVDELLERYADEIAEGDAVLGSTPVKRTSDYLRSLVARLYYEKGVEKWGDEYDIVLGGGYLSVRSPYELKAGEIRYGDLYSIFPFDNELVLCSIKGRDLSSRFFNSSNSNYFIYYGEYGASVKENIDPDATYYIIVDSYSSSYGPNKLTEIEFLGADIYARDLLAEYVKNGGME